MNLQKSIAYFESLIDEQGIIQFSKGYEKDYGYGYAIEDQARGLLLAIELGDTELAEKFFKLICRSITEDGVLMLWDKDGKYQEKIDTQGEAVAEVIWALGSYQKKELVEKLFENINNSPYPRTWAYTILGAAKTGDKDEVILLADKLVKLYEQNATDNWKWFETEMTYGNVLLPWSLIWAYKETGNVKYKKAAHETMEFLLTNLIKDGKPITVGFEGWWKKDGQMAIFGQQPIDVAYMVLACLDFWEITGEARYKQKAEWYFSWFEGNNILNLPMLREDGACFDGLWKDGVNPNAGAESNICYVWAGIKTPHPL